MRIAAIICFVLATLSTIVAIKNVAVQFMDEGFTSHSVGYSIGAFLVPFILFIIGVKLRESS